MTDQAIVLGINRAANGSICVIGGSPFICSIQKERYSRQKHHWGTLGDFRNWYLDRIPTLSEPISLVVECFSSTSQAKQEEYHRELREVLSFQGDPHIVGISHHLSHLYSTFFLSPAKEAAVMIMDFQGSRVADLAESWPGQEQAQPHWVEVSSFYHCDERGVRCLSKQLWNNDRRRPVGLGSFYNYLTHVIFTGRGMEGKVMGLAPYGDPGALRLPPLTIENQQIFIPDQWLEIFQDRSRFRYFKDGSGSFADCANLAAAAQFCFEEAQLRLAEWLYEQTKADVLCLSGGTALNCVSNGRLLRDSPFKDVFVPPSPHDGGTAVGCAIYGMIEVLGQRHDFRWVNDFLAPEPNCDGLEELLTNEPGMIVQQSGDFIAQVADLLESGRTVALYQGRSELGPRALGHRSILADPRHPAIRSWINLHVKGRELFRPLAPVVLEGSASKFFEIDRPVPFMQFAVKVRPEHHTTIPAVIHIDGTARLQTVNEREDPLLYALLKAFEARTGVGVLLNTSLNAAGEPIVETPAEALSCFKSTALHVLAMPPFIVRKQVEPEIPERTERERSRQQELAFPKLAQKLKVSRLAKLRRTNLDPDECFAVRRVSGVVGER